MEVIATNNKFTEDIRNMKILDILNKNILDNPLLHVKLSCVSKELRVMITNGNPSSFSKFNLIDLIKESDNLNDIKWAMERVNAYKTDSELINTTYKYSKSSRIILQFTNNS